MPVTLEETKNYLRIDGSEDDELIESLISAAADLCKNILRVDELAISACSKDTLRIAIFYAVSYLYEHREEANHKELVLTLRCLLFGLRKEQF